MQPSGIGMAVGLRSLGRAGTILDRQATAKVEEDDAEWAR
jgi:hypothetical protein